MPSSGKVHASMHSTSLRTALTWLCLLAILACYVISVWRLQPTNFFGTYQDDSFYLSSARALAEGKGYILPSVPGTPPSRFPIFLPWLLSWVWKWNPSFPAILADAVRVIVGFGCLYVLATFLFLRGLRGLRTADCLLLTVFCALHPAVLFYSSCIQSDIPFAALTLGAMVVANNAIRRDGSAIGSAIAGILAGLSMLTRVLGGPVTAGILVASLWRRAWRHSLIFACFAAPFLGWLFWHTTKSVSAAPPASITSFGPGWQQTWLAYTNYIAFRKVTTGGAHAIWATFDHQLLHTFVEVPGYFLLPRLLKNAGLELISTALILWGIFAGMVRQARRSGWQPIHFVLPFYVALILTWFSTDIQRFLIPFLPLLAASLWSEGKRAAGWVIAAFRGSAPVIERVLAAALALTLVALLTGITWNFADGVRAQMLTSSRERGVLLAEKREAYEWLRRNSPEDARVIAREDVCVYLYTGRQAMERIEYSAAAPYDQVQLRQDLDHLTDVARAIGASYWLASSDEIERTREDMSEIATRLRQIETALPELFRSREGHVRIYGLACVKHPENPSCQSVDRVLFPGGYTTSRP